MKKMIWLSLIHLYAFSLSAVTFHTLDTTSPLQCYLSARFQNRIMHQEQRIQKIISSDQERLSIQMEEATGQAFIYLRDPQLKETSISVISDCGTVQDIHIHFIERLSEVIILQTPEEIALKSIEEDSAQTVFEDTKLQLVQEILSGTIPEGYRPCTMIKNTYRPKRGIELTLHKKLEGPCEWIYVYQVVNTLRQTQELLECELEAKEFQWIFLQNNTLAPKQKSLAIISVAKYDE